MKCDLCGNDFVFSCHHCTRRIKAWGIDGTLALYQLAQTTESIYANKLLEFIYQYYIGKTPKRDAINTLKRSLRILGYSGEFLDRIRKDGHDEYTHIRNREHTAAHRWRLKKDKCDNCGGIDRLKYHHIVPLAWGGMTSEDNGITLCHECHKTIHKLLSANLNRGQLLKYLAPYKTEIEQFAKSSLDILKNDVV